MDGIVYMRQRPILFGAISLDLFAMLLGGTTALLPIFARDVLHTGPAGLGFLRMAPAMGATMVAIVLARWQLHRHTGISMFACVAIFGVATIVFGLSREFYLSMAALVVTGAADMVSVYVRSALVQLATPDHMRGRVGSLNSLFIGASNELGEFRSGLTAFALGLVQSALIARIARSSMLDVLNSEYIRTAAAKGLASRVVVLKHALRNALIPVVTVVGLQIGILLGGTVVVEEVFTLPGIGRLVLWSIYQRDYPLTQSTILFIAVLFMTINLAVDLLYSYLDPRIRYSR